MRIPPLEVLEAWPKPNYTHPETRSQALVVIAGICLAFVVVAVLGRFYSRIVLKRWAGLDDTLIALALLFTIGMTTVVVLANVSYGWNRHVWDLPLSMYAGAGTIAMVAKLFFTLAATFTRLSLLSFYYRLVKDSGVRWFRWALHCNVALSVGIGITFIALSIWLCVPTRAYWTFPVVANSKCLPEGTVMLVGGIINCVADLLTTILPIPIIMTLQMPLRQRIGVCALLCLGFVVTIAGILRTYFIWKSLIDTYDQTWYSYPLWICAMVEIDVAVICACAPAWKSVVHHSLHTVRAHASSSFGSMRSPRNSKRSHNTSDSSTPRSGLTWTQLSSFFERSRLGSGGAEKMGMEMNMRETQGFSGIFQRTSASTVELEPSTAPPLRITRRLSIEQRSSYIKEDSRDMMFRRSFDGVPVQWLREDPGMRSYAMRC